MADSSSYVRIVPPSSKGVVSGLPIELIRETRRSLKLPDSRPVIATGHAPMRWHPGIVTKFMAMRVLSQERQATPLVLNIDTVAGDPGLIEVPFLDADGLPCSSTFRLFESSPELGLGMQPATEPVDLQWLSSLADFDITPLERYAESIRTAGSDLSLASQLMRAQLNMARRWAGRPTVLPASRLLKTACGRWLLDRMQRDSMRCAQAYNAAVSVDPDAGIRPLDMDAGELPLWEIRSADRRTARRQDLDESNLLPKALVTTAIMRLAGCDLFIHGTGGARYDALMESWIREWLGLEVMPFMVATSDVRLPLPGLEDIARVGQSLVSRDRRAYHDPESNDEAQVGPGPRKQAALDSIQSAPRGSDARREAFASMHETLATLRDVKRQASSEVAGRVRDARRTTSRRDWDFFFYPEDVMDALADDVEKDVLKTIR